MPQKNLRLLKYITRETRLKYKIKEVLRESEIFGQITSFKEITGRADTELLGSLVYSINYTTKEFFYFILHKSKKLLIQEGGLKFVIKKRKEIIIKFDKNCSIEKIGSTLKQEIYERKQISTACFILEQVCKNLSIKIEGKTESSTSESVYYKLFKSGKFCNVRISLHSNYKFLEYNFDFILFKYNVSDFESKVIQGLKLFFNK